MVADNHYDDDALLKLLRQRTGDGEDSALAHVESCATCQAKLETISQSGMTWDEVSDLLRPDETSFIAERREPSGEELGSLLTSATSFLEPTDHPDSLGRFARYEIMELLGRGGMGIVMRGFDTSLNRHSAIKVLAPELASSAAARKRFSREAKSAAAVVHPHVVPIQTVDEHDGLPYLVMPVVQGQNLQQRVERDGPLSVIETVRIAAQVAEGLQAAHQQGLVHRDIKPANVLLENGVERVQITDFGLARAVDDASMTRSGVIAGTPQYMSPEQAHGDTIDHRSDLFSLGSLIYFMLTGRSPFRAETTMGVLNRIGNDEPRSIRSINAEVPDWLEQVVMRLLAKSPDARYQSAREVAELLQEWHAHLQQPEAVRQPSEPTALAAGSHPNLTPEASVFGSGGRHIKWLIATAAFAFFAFAGVLIVLEMNKGTLTIESEVDDVPIRIVQGDEVVKKLTLTKGAESIRIASGQYTVALDGRFSDVRVEGSSVSLGNGGAQTIRIVKAEESLKVADVEDPQVAVPNRNPSDISETGQSQEKAVLEVILQINHLRREGKHREWLELVDDAEIQRLAGITLMGRSQHQLVLDMLGDLANDLAAFYDETATSLAFVETTKPYIRTDAPTDAVDANDHLAAIVKSLSADVLDAVPKDVESSHSQIHGVDDYSELLRNASGVLTDPRDFLAAAFQVDDVASQQSMESDTSAKWSVIVDGNQVTATDLNHADDSFSYIELRKDKTEGWRITKLVKDEDVLAMMNLLVGGNVVLEMEEHHHSDEADREAVLLVLETLARLGSEGHHRQSLELIDDEEIRRFAGLVMIGRAQMKLQLTLVGDLAEEIAKSDTEYATALKVVAATDPLFRTDASANATSASNLLSAIATTQFAAVLGGDPKEIADFQSQLHGIASYSQLLRSASGVLTDPRAFIAAMSEHNNILAVGSEDNTAQWEIKVDGEIAIATKINSEKSEDPLTVELRSTKKGEWRISKLVDDESFLAMMMLVTGTSQESTENLEMEMESDNEGTVPK